MTEKSIFQNSQRPNTTSSNTAPPSATPRDTSQSNIAQPDNAQTNAAQQNSAPPPGAPKPGTASPSAGGGQASASGATPDSKGATQSSSIQGVTQSVSPASSAQADRSASLKAIEEQSLYERMNRIYDSIAHRAFEIFEGDGWADGRDRDHWFKAEAELLHPVHVQIKESDLALTVQAEVPGFNANELQYRLEPQRLTIIGRKQSTAENKASKTVYKEQCSHEILRVIELPARIDASRAATSLRDGILEFTLPKATGAASTVSQEQAKAATAR